MLWAETFRSEALLGVTLGAETCMAQILGVILEGLEIKEINL